MKNLVALLCVPGVSLVASGCCLDSIDYVGVEAANVPEEVRAAAIHAATKPDQLLWEKSQTGGDPATYRASFYFHPSGEQMFVYPPQGKTQGEDR